MQIQLHLILEKVKLERGGENLMPKQFILILEDIFAQLKAELTCRYYIKQASKNIGIDINKKKTNCMTNQIDNIVKIIIGNEAINKEVNESTWAKKSPPERQTKTRILTREYDEYGMRNSKTYSVWISP